MTVENKNTHLNTLGVLNIIFIVIFLSQIIFLAITIFLYYNDSLTAQSNISDFVKTIVMLSVLGIVIIAKILYGKAISKIDMKTSLDQKINTYRTKSILRLALLGAANFIILVAFILTAEYIYLLIF